MAQKRRDDSLRNIISTRVSNAEMKVLQDRAQALGTNISALLRKSLNLDSTKRIVRPEEGIKRC